MADEDNARPPSRPVLLTRREAAEYARVSVSTIDRAIRAGRLRASRNGPRGAVRIRLSWLLAWLDDSSTLLFLLAIVDVAHN